ncbi:MAG: hypothetical protein Q9219_001648 [cf. Caloplaca sp. 3 TL-2023]
MEPSLPVLESSAQELLCFASHNLIDVSTKKDSSSAPPSIIEENEQPTYRDAQAWLATFQKRLPADKYDRFLKLIERCYSEKCDIESIRETCSQLFADADESEVWEGFWESFVQSPETTRQIEESQQEIVSAMSGNSNMTQAEIDEWLEWEQQV